MPGESDGEYGQGYLDEIFDWGKFELFVKEFYKSDGELIVEHNVRERGKSGRWRQTDVKVTLKTKLHTYITLIECKRWKNKVDGDRVDVLAAKIEDLNASKGVIITTI
ncbi:restriction endonuclease, partial [Methanothrix sp.]|uniref:restriction endonuclease n=1 Tax=Methanothrix sp. TaxID=90426 RepID=UPI003BB6C7EA